MIKGAIKTLRKKTELIILILVALLCLLAIKNPSIQFKKSITSYMLLVDVSQSMNAEDLIVKDSSITRIEYTKLLLKQIIDKSDCGSFFSINIFVADNIANIIEPVEKCKNYFLRKINDSCTLRAARRPLFGHSEYTRSVYARS